MFTAGLLKYAQPKPRLLQLEGVGHVAAVVVVLVGATVVLAGLVVVVGLAVVLVLVLVGRAVVDVEGGFGWQGEAWTAPQRQAKTLTSVLGFNMVNGFEKGGF